MFMGAEPALLYPVTMQNTSALQGLDTAAAAPMIIMSPFGGTLDFNNAQEQQREKPHSLVPEAVSSLFHPCVLEEFGLGKGLCRHQAPGPALQPLRLQRLNRPSLGANASLWIQFWALVQQGKTPESFLWIQTNQAESNSLYNQISQSCLLQSNGSRERGQARCLDWLRG